ncbi:alanine--tRNA ligase, cytoplasmic-like [Argopecten irradians]|uniref:alanine--tRNA ligase, cytoplasmic-like n=1 Tax=Argopecten irradians TaxID=31199 RepID=UPI00371119EF
MWLQPRSGGQAICKRCLRYIRSTPRYFHHQETWTSARIRQTYVDFFKNYDHQIVPSSSIIPVKDGGTYFTNAGMNQFKPIFLETVDPHSKMADYRRVTNHQKCIRVGGKHNDLEAVGKDLYHHTFFEMLGSWSFGDYFKKEACTMALELLTKVYGLPVSRLYFTYFSGDAKLGLHPDLETKNIWQSLGIPQKRVLPFYMEDNFWDMGKTGPCGPCTEIHYDHTGDGTGVHLVNRGSPRVVEIWNLVFMQYNRCEDSSLTSLARHHVDTGMGLERITAVLQNTESNYDTDLFSPLFKAISKETKLRPYQGLVGEGDETGIDTAYRVIADHIRMSSISIGDGLLPNRAGLGLTLRNVMSQCFHQAYQVLGMPHGSVSGLVDVVVDSLGDAYPELQKNHSKIKNITKDAEKWYTSLVSSSEMAFSKFVNKNASQRDHNHLSVEDMMNLHKGKYGSRVPLTVMKKITVKEGYTMEEEAFEEAIMKEQQLDTVVTSDILKLTGSMIESLKQRGIPCTDDSFKYHYSSKEGKYVFLDDLKGNILGLVDSEGFVDEVSADVQCGILMNKSMFYSEAGGQAADIGYIKTENGSFRVEDVQTFDCYVLHIGHVESGSLCMGEVVSQTIDQEHRLGCMRNHTATHLLLAALRKVMDTNLEQAGSSITSDSFSFDFTTPVKMEADHVTQVEDLVKEAIYRNVPVKRKMYPRDVAMEMENIIPLRDEVYPSNVYVLSIGNSGSDNLMSTELCGGTHVSSTDDIRDFYITSVIRSNQATKRIYAVTGQYTQQVYETGQRAMDLLLKIKSEIHDKDKAKDLMGCLQELQDMSNLNMPKVMRDKVYPELSPLVRRVSGLESQRLTAIAQKVITKEIAAQQSSSYVLCRSDLRKEKQGIKLLMKQTDLDKPLCLVSDLQDSILIAIAGPEVSKSCPVLRGFMCLVSDLQDSILIAVIGPKVSKSCPVLRGFMCLVSDLQDSILIAVIGPKVSKSCPVLRGFMCLVSDLQDSILIAVIGPKVSKSCPVLRGFMCLVSDLQDSILIAVIGPKVSKSCPVLRGFMCLVSDLLDSILIAVIGPKVSKSCPVLRGFMCLVSDLQDSILIAVTGPKVSKSCPVLRGFMCLVSDLQDSILIAVIGPKVSKSCPVLRGFMCLVSDLQDSILIAVIGPKVSKSCPVLRGFMCLVSDLQDSILIAVTGPKGFMCLVSDLQDSILIAIAGPKVSKSCPVLRGFMCLVSDLQDSILIAVIAGPKVSKSCPVLRGFMCLVSDLLDSILIAVIAGPKVSKSCPVLRGFMCLVSDLQDSILIAIAGPKVSKSCPVLRGFMCLVSDLQDSILIAIAGPKVSKSCPVLQGFMCLVSDLLDSILIAVIAGPKVSKSCPVLRGFMCLVSDLQDSILIAIAGPKVSKSCPVLRGFMCLVSDLQDSILIAIAGPKVSKSCPVLRGFMCLLVSDLLRTPFS